MFMRLMSCHRCFLHGPAHGRTGVSRSVCDAVLLTTFALERAENCEYEHGLAAGKQAGELSVVHNVAYSSDSLQSAMRKQHLYVYTRTAICPSTACLHG